MLILKTKDKITLNIKRIKNDHKTIGFVPTMGALHYGHLSLLEKAKKQNDIVVCSIFVNPTQFNDPKDLKNYPQTIDKDIEQLKNLNTDILFIPNIDEMYPEGEKSEKFDLGNLETVMEGKYRKGHFQGVATIVKRLFKMIRPNNAYFGEKDFQQLAIIKKMTLQEKFNINIVSVPTLREEDGLAMSSRNTLLTQKQRNKASLIYKILKQVQEKIKSENNIQKIKKWVNTEFEKESEFALEYFEITNEKLEVIKDILPNTNYRAFIAVFAGKIRLIDNIELYTKI